MLHISIRFSLLLEIFSTMKFYNFSLIDTDYRWSSHILDDDCKRHTTRFYEKFVSSLSIKICEICLMQRNTSKSCKLSFTLNTANHNLKSCREGNWFCYEQSTSLKSIKLGQKHFSHKSCWLWLMLKLKHCSKSLIFTCSNGLLRLSFPEPHFDDCWYDSHSDIRSLKTS